MDWTATATLSTPRTCCWVASEMSWASSADFLEMSPMSRRLSPVCTAVRYPDSTSLVPSSIAITASCVSVWIVLINTTMSLAALAERSAKAAKDIVVLIKTIQTETQEAVIAMEDGTKEVESGYRTAVQTGESLRDIGDISKKSAELAQDISLATQQQVRGVESVAVAVQSIAGVAVQTEKGVVEARKTMDHVVKLAEELMTSLTRFKLAN